MEENTKVKEFIADSNVAFMQGNYEKALEMAKKAKMPICLFQDMMRQSKITKSQWNVNRRKVIDIFT